MGKLGSKSKSSLIVGEGREKDVVGGNGQEKKIEIEIIEKKKSEREKTKSDGIDDEELQAIMITYIIYNSTIISQF